MGDLSTTKQQHQAGVTAQARHYVVPNARPFLRRTLRMPQHTSREAARAKPPRGTVLGPQPVSFNSVLFDTHPHAARFSGLEGAAHRQVLPIMPACGMPAAI